MSINTLKTAALLGFLTALLLIGGQAIAGRQGLYIALAVTALMRLADATVSATEGFTLRSIALDYRAIGRSNRSSRAR